MFYSYKFLYLILKVSSMFLGTVTKLLFNTYSEIGVLFEQMCG